MQLTVIGLGLIGASCCAAIKKYQTNWVIHGYSRSKETRKLAQARGYIDQEFDTIFEAIRGSELALIAVPIGQFRSVYEDINACHHEGLVVTDAGSTKSSIVEDVVAVSGSVPPWFIPAHPIAGSEKSGVEAANADLYVAHQVILTPNQFSDIAAIERVREFWICQGASVAQMQVAHHDEVLALTSHLPHILSFNLVHMLSDHDDHLEIFRYAAGGFRDFTRIAGSDPTMWQDICLANSEAIINGIDRYIERLHKMRSAIEKGDSEWLVRSFKRAQGARRLFSSLSDQGSRSIMNPHPSILHVSGSQRGLSGIIRVPGDKSISHRSIMLGALADGITTIEGFLESEDAIATVQAFRDMGVQIDGPDNNGRVTIIGVGRDGLQAPKAPLYLGNSGTSMRLLSGILAGQSFDSELTGDNSLTRRPMGRVADPLLRMGASVTTKADGTPPITICGGKQLTGCHIDMNIASAQVKSALLLAGIYAAGKTSVTEPAITRDHTERMLAGFGYPVARMGATSSIQGGGRLTACHINIPSDISSAAFFIVAATIVPESDLIIKHIGLNPTRLGILEILKLMGANIEFLNLNKSGGEPVADLRIRSAQLRGIDVPRELVSLAIDEFPILFVAASCALGKTIVTGAHELRVKESDRIQAMVDGLQKLDVLIEGTADGAIIEGGGDRFYFGSGVVEAHEDHRIAMAFSVAGLRSDGKVIVKDCNNIATSFPNFVAIARDVGFDLVIEQ